VIDSNATDSSQGPRLGRRGAMLWLGRGFLALWVPAIGAMAASFLKAPSKEMRPGERQLSAGKLSTLAVGDARLVRHSDQPVFVVRVAESQVLAVSAVCTHMRCVLRWKRENATFQCPCHDGAFDRTGNVLSGPPKKPLPQFAAEIRADEIIVHS
jgi:cytochrome b6-f complex iron-sulfur subunit